jgi:hypothetical protein
MGDINLPLIALLILALVALVVIIASQRPRSTLGYLLLGALLCFAGLGVFVNSKATYSADVDWPVPFSLVLARPAIDFTQFMPEGQDVRVIRQEDTDGDGHKEWVVLYQFDLGDRRYPYAGAIYDFDRGDPPVLFPYRLQPPERDYLSEDSVNVQFRDIISTGEETQSTPEIFIYGNSGGLTTNLTIFRHIPNSLPWEYPRDEPRRYQPIGYFRGDGGISYSDQTHKVTVIERVYDRSQLAIETIYSLDKKRDTYMSPSNPNELSAPVSSKVTFAFGMPDDILDSPYPEKIVLGFYETMMQSTQEISPAEFLTGEALIFYSEIPKDPATWSYFGVDGVTPGDKVTDLKVTELKYSPEVESFDPSITILGEDPQYMIVSVKFDAFVGGRFFRTEEPVVWITKLVNGKWRIERHPI